MEETKEEYHLRRLAEEYVYSQSGGPSWTDDQRRAVVLQLQWMALSVTDIEGWRVAVHNAEHKPQR